VCGFPDLDPLATIRGALVETLKLPKAEVEALGLIELLNKGFGAASEGSPNFKSLILIFDQFEQFFVYTDNAERRSAFIQALASWYGNNELKEKVKILVSIREDWFARMDEIQAALNYTLRIGGQTGGNSFYLKNFSAEEATMILGVMAQEDLGIEAEDTVRFDRDYIQEVLERELSSPTDHLISPVDLQIIAETIKQQNMAELRSFNRTALQRLGGIEGLRRSFLENILEPLEAERQKSAVQVLVALTNLEQQTRAEVQTLEQLQEKVKEIILPQEVERILGSLQETGLIAQAERGGVQGYELAHEGMIEAVIRVGEKIQDGAYRANQLLERRVNEWLGNGRSSRYLFSLKELWLLKRQRPYLIWGSTREYKHRLIANSKQRVRRNLGLVAIVTLMGAGVWGWLNHTTWGQIQQVQWQLKNLTSKNKRASDTAISKATLAFAKNNDFINALQICKRGINSPKIKIQALSAVAEVYINNKNESRAREILIDSLDTAKESKELDDNPEILASIIRAIEKIKNKTISREVLNQAVNIVVGRKNFYENPKFLGVIASAYASVEDRKTAEKFLFKALKKFKENEEFYELTDRGETLNTIVEAYISLKDKIKAQELLQKYSSVSNKLTKSSIDSNNELLSFVWLSRSYIKLGDEVKAADTLKKAINISAKVERSYEFGSSDVLANVFGKAQAIHLIVESIGELKDANTAKKLLQLSIAASEKFEPEARI
jgi:tetratricopeptide (TPR) repeat protein